METSKNLSVVFILLVVAGQHIVNLVTCYSVQYSFQTNSIDDGRKLVTNIASRHFDSRRHQEPEVSREIVIGPSGSRLANNHLITKNQVNSNEIGTGLEESLFGQTLFGKRPAVGNFHRLRGYITKPRTVESPALSVDSGGRSSSSVASEIAKLLHINQGHYSDIYDKIEMSPNQQAATTKRPADAVEDAVRAAVVDYYRRQQNRNIHHNQPAKTHLQ